MSKKDIALWLYWKPFRKILRALPPGSIYPVARIGAHALCAMAKGKRRAIEAVFNELDGRFGPEAVAEAFRSLMYNELETLLFPDLRPGNIDSYVVCDDFARLGAALAHGKGVMLLFAHFGANQMVMPAVGHKGYRMCQLSAPSTVWENVLPGRKFSNMEKEAMRLRWECELSLPVTHINIFGSLKKAFQCLRGNEILGIAIDGGGGKNRVAVEFFGKTAYFSTGAMDLALRSGCVVLPTFMTRTESGASKMIFEDPMTLVSGMEHEEALKINTQAFVKRLEDYVRRFPGLYGNFLALRKFMETQGELPFIESRQNAQDRPSQGAGALAEGV
ncbi:MAG: lysophospholipid acyltransferase family protein [Nitrospinae bacterium]|nr:lysophospholipid acyltransferase family protein [Nitrospinota bacterium]